MEVQHEKKGGKSPLSSLLSFDFKFSIEELIQDVVKLKREAPASEITALPVFLSSFDRLIPTHTDSYRLPSININIDV